jgi:xanthine dehydrogenase accessory factor
MPRPGKKRRANDIASPSTSPRSRPRVPLLVGSRRLAEIRRRNGPTHTSPVQTLAAQVARWEGRGDWVAIAMVVAAERSTPRPLGAKMAINDRGETAGRISGGYVESALVEIAERVIHRAEPELTTFGIADEEAWGAGLPCGGEITVWVECHAANQFLNVAQDGGRAVEVTVLQDTDVGEKLIVKPDGTSSGTLGTPDRDSEAVHTAIELLWAEHSVRRGRLFYDVAAPPPSLILVGANHLARSLCTLARAAGWRPYVIDPRSRFATAALFPDAEQVIAAWPAEAFQTLGGIDPAASIVTLSHDPKLDDAALRIALRSPARFIGVMGSQHATRCQRDRLETAGLSAEELERLAAPIGLDLGAANSEETAVSILAEVIGARHGHPGRRLADTTGRIDEDR